MRVLSPTSFTKSGQMANYKKCFRKGFFVGPRTFSTSQINCLRMFARLHSSTLPVSLTLVTKVQSCSLHIFKRIFIKSGVIIYIKACTVYLKLWFYLYFRAYKTSLLWKESKLKGFKFSPILYIGPKHKASLVFWVKDLRVSVINLTCLRDLFNF